jgi:hypothetical protein
VLGDEVVVAQLLVLVDVGVVGASQLIVELSLISLIRGTSIAVSALLDVLKLLKGQTIAANLGFWDDEAVPV